MYSFKNKHLLDLPAGVMASISAMQVSPVAPVFIRKPNAGGRKPIKKTAENDDNWRREFIAELKAKPRDKDDPDYEKIIGLINKVVSSTLIEKTKTISETIGNRTDDNGFRMRVVNFVFDRGVSMPFYAKLLADMLVLLSNEIPAVHEDLQIYCSLDTFNKMFDQSKTIAFPDSSQPDFEDKVCAWNKQKELKRGFGVFAAELHTRKLIPDSLLHEAAGVVLSDLEENIRKPKNETISESVDQTVTFMVEMSKLFGKETMLLSNKASDILKIPRSESTCLSMRSRFKLEDCVRKT
jgi:hypothetical protein